MAQVPTDLLNPTAYAEATGQTLTEVSKNAKKKQYDLTVTLRITENESDKEFFDNTLKYTGLPYGAMVAIEDALLNVLGKLTNIGEAIALGKVPPGPIGPT